MNELFKGVCPVINVPFMEGGDLDPEGLGAVIEYVLQAGCSNVAVLALNSEPHKMTRAEKEVVISAFLDHVGKRANKLVGIVENSLRGAAELATLACRRGAEGIILFPPSLVPPSGDHLMAYFKSIAAEVDCRVMIQDAPRTTGVTMTTQFLLHTFHEIENFSYLKVECPLPVQKIAEITGQTDNKLRCLSGNGGIFAIDAFKRGAWGVMPGIGVIEYFVRLYECFSEGQEKKARDIFENLMPLLWFEDQSLEFFIACEKELLKFKGVIQSSHVREPRLQLNTATLNELMHLYHRLDTAYLD